MRQVLAPVVGSLVYYQLISFCLTLGLAPADLKFATGAFVLLMLALPNLRKSGGGVQIREKIRE